jgi:hypothetical protein
MGYEPARADRLDCETTRIEQRQKSATIGTPLALSSPFERRTQERFSAMQRDPSSNVERRGSIGLAAGSLLLTSVTGLACVGPFVAILLGVGGLGHLTRYAQFRVPASVLTFALLAMAFYRVYGRTGATCTKNPPAFFARLLLWTSAVLAVAINALEYAILERLG